MFLRLAGIVVLACGVVLSASAQSLQSPVIIDEDIRIFATVAALNVAGFDAELGAQYHPVRAELRKISDTLDPDLLRRLREFYRVHKNGRADEEQLSKYISLALLLSPPPEFKIVAREETLPDDVRSILTFQELLREFYQKGGVSRLWTRLEPLYESEMDRVGPFLRDAVNLTDAYLRIPSGTRGVQSMRITVELGAPQNSVNLRSHQDDFFIVLGYAATPKISDIRHAYLHFRLNSYVTGVLTKVEKRDRFIALLAGRQDVQPEYASSFDSLMTESLIRAIELRIDRTPSARAEESIRNSYRSGLLLTPYFYSALAKYEAGEVSFLSEVASLAAGIDFGKEQTRFQQTFQSIPVPEPQPLRAEIPPPQPKVDPVNELLKTAQSVFEKDKPRAREAFEKVLHDYDSNNGRALYGMALIEMDLANLDEALQYFGRTLTSNSADPSMKTWSYIYTGHIFDFRCERTAALENYRKAVATGDNTRDAQNVAKRDIAKPYGIDGEECRPQ